MKKNLIFAGILLALAAGTAFWIPALRRSGSPHPSSSQSSTPQAPAPDKAHELKMLSEHLKKKPGHAPVLLRMAELEREAGKTAEATKHLQEAVKAEPDNRDALLELGRALYESGDIDGALAATKRLVELDPSNVDGLYNLGAIYGNRNDLAQARRYWAEAVKAAPDSDSGRRAKSALDQTAPLTTSAR